MVEIK